MPLLFSYGSLQQASVQLSTFGRLLKGHRDELPGFESVQVRIEDPQLAAADQYEQGAGHARIAVTLASGKPAWVYVDARSAPRAV